VAGFYSTRPWRKLRRRIILAAGLPLEPGIHVHHVYHLKDHPILGLEPLNLKPMTRAEHMRLHAKPKGCDVHGNPHDPDHPWNRWKNRKGKP